MTRTIPLDAILAEVRAATEYNDHNAARLEIARWAMDTAPRGAALGLVAAQCWRVFDAIETIHAEAGSLTPELVAIREARTVQLLAAIHADNADAADKFAACL